MSKIILIIIISLFFGAARAQSRSDIPLDTLYSALELGTGGLHKGVKLLPQYEAEPCLFSLLNDIVKNDDKCSREVGYYFSCVKVERKLLLKIHPVNLGRLRSANFFGYFVYNKRSFLCYGDVRCYVSKKSIDNPLALRLYTSNSLQVSDFYLGGDTNGVLKLFDCNNGKQYVLVKTCINPAEQKARRNQKERR